MGVIDAVLQERRVKAGMKLRRDQMRIGGYGGGGQQQQPWGAWIRGHCSRRGTVKRQFYSLVIQSMERPCIISESSFKESRLSGRTGYLYIKPSDRIWDIYLATGGK